MDIVTGLMISAIALQSKNILSPAAKQVGLLIEKPFILVNSIFTKEMATVTKDSFIFICEKLSKKNTNNLPYIQSPNIKSIHEILNILRWSYDDDSVKTELLYEILFKLITNPTKEEDELFHTKTIETLYLNSLDVLYLVYKLSNIIIEDHSDCILNYNDNEIYAKEYLDPSIKKDCQYLNELENDVKFRNKSSMVFSNNINITDKFRYLQNLQQNHLISNYPLEYKEKKRLLFNIEGKDLISHQLYIMLNKYKYYVKDQGLEILQYYKNDVIEKIKTI